MNNSDSDMDRIYCKNYDEYINFVNVTIKYLRENYPKKYCYHTKNQKYNCQTIIVEAIYLLSTGISYANYRGPVNSKTLNKHILFLSENSIFEKIYNIILDKYIGTYTFSKLKYQSIDTTFIQNKNGKEDMGRNTLIKNKNSYKVSIISDTNRIPLIISINSGNIHDSKIAMIDMKKYKYSEINKSIKPYILGDKGYDSRQLRDICSKNNIRPLFDYNIRNTKNKDLIKKFTKKENNIYKKRIIVENSFCIFKKFKRVQLIYDSLKNTFKSFVFMAFGLMISKLC